MLESQRQESSWFIAQLERQISGDRSSTFTSTGKTPARMTTVREKYEAGRILRVDRYPRLGAAEIKPLDNA